MTTTLEGLAPSIETWTEPIAPTMELETLRGVSQAGPSTVAPQPEIQEAGGEDLARGLLRISPEAYWLDIRPGQRVFRLDIRPGQRQGVRALGEVGRRPTPTPVPSQLISPPAAPPATDKPFVKHLEHLDYLRRVSTEGNPPPITRETATLARVAWQAIWKVSGFSMPIPAACTGPDGEMFYSWDRG